jgi:hypothetical protein
VQNNKGFKNLILITTIILFSVAVAYFLVGNKPDDKEILKNQIAVECSKGGKVITDECARLMEEGRQKYPEEFPSGINKSEPYTMPTTPPNNPPKNIEGECEFAPPPSGYRWVVDEPFPSCKAHLEKEEYSN